ncbi:MAG TPA: hypothetical protein VN451_05000 [Chitinophagaceae bacterium]|nr:hypothetical protein [Chitinophagaceae bacterium]
MFFKKRNIPAEQKLQKTIPLPTQAEDKRYSALFTTVGQPGRTSPALLTFGLSCAADAPAIDLSSVSSRIKN